MTAAATFYQVWNPGQEGITNGSRKFNNEEDARERASDLDEYVILRRRQVSEDQEKIWTDRNVEIVEGDYWSEYLDEITDVEVDQQ